jgi:phosphate transport system substrate-binding protein
MSDVATSTGPDRVESGPPDLVRSNPAIWGLVVLVVVGLVVAALLIVRGIERGPQPPFLVQPPVSPVPVDVRRDERVLHIAGSGSNLPLARELADAYSVVNPDARLVIHQSIGSTGGVRATHDGAIDLGLVSRQLKPSEAAFGLRYLPYARVAVVFAVDAHVPVQGLSSEEVVALYAGEREAWSDGTPVVVLQREEGDSSHLVAREAIEGFASVDDRSLDEGRWRVLYSDRAMHDALVSTSGAIGLIDHGAGLIDDLDVRMLSLDGVRPSPTSVEDGSYPMSKSLAFVAPGDASERARAFMDFVFSPAGQEVMRAHGYLPVERGAR